MSRSSLWSWLMVGLAVRLAIAPLGAHPGDFATLTGWAEAIHARGWINVYAATDANYPPLSLAVLGASRWVYGLFASGPAAGPLWMILLKLPAILADLGIVWAINDSSQLSAVSHQLTAKTKAGWLGLAVVIFNPALIVLSAWWGQYESVYALFALLGVLAARDGRAFRAGLWLGLGVMVKLQAAVVAPIILLAWAGTDHAMSLSEWIKRLGLGLALPVMALIGPFSITGQGELVALRLVALIAAPGWLTVNALNLWYLVTGGAGNWQFNTPLAMPDTAPILFGVPARTIGLILLGAWSLCVMAAWLFPRHPHPAYRPPSLVLTGEGNPSVTRMGGGGGIFLAAALLYLGAFFFPTQSHERYAFGALVMLAGAAASTRSGAKAISLLPLAVATLLHFGNLIWAAPFSPMLDGWLAGSPTVGLAISVLGGSGCVAGLLRLWARQTQDEHLWPGLPIPPGAQGWGG